ncbi:MAG: OB-fold domain-containing protein [Dehalococcoidia bacterium]|jgi:hypothetical protein|nr:OB-fold domain-containing protein [Dehalococcoidia bacterium]MDW8009092.1 OB-fold domain-containing protein [Chloroflexota bacterium]
MSGAEEATQEVKRVPFTQGAFVETPQGPRLIGSKCPACGTVFFPKADVCRVPSCMAQTEEMLLGPRGKLWSYSIQYFKPPPPIRVEEPFRPYAVGMVDMDGVRIIGMLTEADLEVLRPDMEVELVIDMLYRDADGNEVVTWKFRPLR